LINIDLSSNVGRLNGNGSGNAGGTGNGGGNGNNDPRYITFGPRDFVFMLNRLFLQYQYVAPVQTSIKSALDTGIITNREYSALMHSYLAQYQPGRTPASFNNSDLFCQNNEARLNSRCFGPALSDLN
jgi:hypothetical protein